MGCPPVRGDNPRALASGLSYVQEDKHGITILNHLHQCRPCTNVMALNQFQMLKAQKNYYQRNIFNTLHIDNSAL